MRLAAAALATWAALAPASALADWQQTRWGMSLAELKATGLYGLRPPTAAEIKKNRMSDDLRLGAIGQYEASGVKFEALFYFSDDRLREVRLVPPSLQAANKIDSDLGLIYGKPTAERRQSVGGGGCLNRNRQWRDERHGNVITSSILSCINAGIWKGEAFYSISYEPILSSEKSGL